MTTRNPQYKFRWLDGKTVRCRGSSREDALRKLAERPERLPCPGCGGVHLKLEAGRFLSGSDAKAWTRVQDAEALVDARFPVGLSFVCPDCRLSGDWSMPKGNAPGRSAERGWDGEMRPESRREGLP